MIQLNTQELLRTELRGTGELHAHQHLPPDDAAELLCELWASSLEERSRAQRQYRQKLSPALFFLFGLLSCFLLFACLQRHLISLFWWWLFYFPIALWADKLRPRPHQLQVTRKIGRALEPLAPQLRRPELALSLLPLVGLLKRPALYQALTRLLPLVSSERLERLSEEERVCLRQLVSRPWSPELELAALLALASMRDSQAIPLACGSLVHSTDERVLEAARECLRR